MRFVYATDGLRNPDFFRRVSRELFYGGHCGAVLRASLEWLEKAETFIGEIEGLGWQEILRCEWSRVTQLLTDIDEIVAKNMRRVLNQPRVRWEASASEDPWQRLAENGLNFLLGQWGLGFGEVGHHLYVGQRGAGTGAPSYPKADLFQRAIIADVICDAIETLGSSLEEVLEYEVDYILSRHQEGALGWSYLPELPELPTDTDTIGQVLQVLLRAGRRDEAFEHGEGALDLLFREGARDDGSFRTWMVSAEAATDLEQAQVRFASYWGGDYTSEVMANLLYALVLYDRKRFLGRIEAGAEHIVSRQELDGHWESFWYRGAYYGTYVCLRFLSYATPESPAIPRAVRYLRGAQNDDGGWGLDGGASDPLSTALALLGLANACRVCSLRLDGEGIEAARALLDDFQKEEGWSAVPLLSMPMFEINPSHGSRTLTAAFVTKAALAWIRAPREEAAAADEAPLGIAVKTADPLGSGSES